MQALGDRAAAIVTDEYPTFFLPRMVRAVAPRVRVRFEAVDANGIVPLARARRRYLRAVDFRRFSHAVMADCLAHRPLAYPRSLSRLSPFGSLPRGIAARWPAADDALLRADAGALAHLPIDHAVRPAAGLAGGLRAARAALDRFLRGRLSRYADDRNHPDLDATSGLSPYLHFGHISPHEILESIAAAEGGSLDEVGRDGDGDAFWKMSPGAEAFLDQLITWRELGFHDCYQRPDAHAEYASLPDWARATLAEHARDPRPRLYDLDALEHASTGDPVWNAAQRELLATGHIHNYLRMLWGKKVLEWSPSPEEALARLVHLNNKYALDGRDPNSYSGIFWCFGRYDRPWGERPIFGMVRYMSSDSALRKLKMKRYLARWGGRSA